MSWLSDNPWLAWAALALVLLAVEAATVDLVFIMLAGGAVVAAVAAALGAPFALQVILGVVVALLLIGLVRPIAVRQLRRPGDAGAIGAAALPGREGRVVEAVTETDGRIRLAGETWSARVPDGTRTCAPGEEVRVVAIDGATAVVEPLGDPSSRPL